MTNHTLYKGDCSERLKDVDEESVHLCITSPPYYNARDYHSEDENVGNNETYQDYLDKIKNILQELFRVMVGGGLVVWNTSPVIYEGQRYMIPQDTHNLFIELGYVCRDDITWVKPMGAAKLRCGGWFQNNGKPLTWHPNINTEYLMVYKKPGEKREGKFKPIKTYYPEIPKDLTSSVWFINPETNKHYHDAPFPEEIVKRCILLYSFEGETVLDPFAGSFTTSKVARDLGRNSIGIELSPEYIKIGKEVMGFYQKSLFSEVTYEEK